MNLLLTTPREMMTLLCKRLVNERLVQGFTQTELARRAGINTNTVSNLEHGKNVTFESVVRVAMVLGRTDELHSLFLPKLKSLRSVEKYEVAKNRKRVRKKSSERTK